jgi:hypothetical protein
MLLSIDRCKLELFQQLVDAQSVFSQTILWDWHFF